MLLSVTINNATTKQQKTNAVRGVRFNFRQSL
jgi:hypothetical protein